MKQKLLSYILLLCVGVPSAYTQGSFVAPSGQTLYFWTVDLLDGDYYAGICSPNLGSNSWEGYTKPTGNLIIPSEIMVDHGMGLTAYPVKYVAGFAGCTGLTSVTIPSSVLQIVDSAFAGCTGLTSVSIPSSVEIIYPYAFAGCTGLTSVTIPSVYTILDSAFYNCSGMTSLTLGDYVQWIFRGAFSNCTGLTSIISKNGAAPYLLIMDGDGVIPMPGSEVFGNVSTTIPIYIPCGSTDSYINNSYVGGWGSYFSNFIERGEGVTARSISVNSADETMGAVRVVKRPTCSSNRATIAATPNPGYGFVNWTENNTVVSNSAVHSFTASSDCTLTAHFRANCNITIDDLPYTENFDSYTTSTTPKTGVQPDCWTLVHQDVFMTDSYTPMIYYSNSLAHSGNYSLILNMRGIYAMPRYEGDVSSLQLSMYLKQTQAKYQLQVGVMSDLGDASSFVPVAVINNSGTNIEHVTVSFADYAGAGRYIAFRNILAPGHTGDYSCNYIDDLTLSSNEIYTVSATSSPSAGGTVSGARDYTGGSTCTLEATPNPGYVFNNWTSGSTIISTNPVYSFTVTANCSLIANFVRIYSVMSTANPAEGGIVTGMGTYRQGATCIVEATPAPGYVFSDWTSGSTIISTNPVYSFTVTANCSLIANFVRIYSVMATANPAEGGIVTGMGTYRQGATCTVEATPAPGYVFSDWTSGSTIVSTNATYSFTVTSNRTLTANFTSVTPIVICEIDEDDLPYSDNFDNYTTSTNAKTGVEPDCWTLAKQDVNMTDEYKPMIYYASANAHSGNYSLILNKRGIYAMPEFDGDVSTLQLSMYLKQGMAKYQLQVGVMSDLTNANTFVPIATLNNLSTGMEYVEVDFSTYSGNGHHIAFRNILAPGYTGDYSCNYIDDLTLDLRPVNTCTGITVDDLPYTDNFDSYTTSRTAKTGVEPDCWTLAHQDVTMADEYKPMVYYASSNAHSGSYSLILNKRGIYAMPEFEGDVSTLQLSMYLKQGMAKYQLQVGVISDLTNANTFVPIATLNNLSTGMEYVEVDFSTYSGNGHYIAFRNILAPGYTGDYSCNYIDDLTLGIGSGHCGIALEDLPYTDNFDTYTTSTTTKTGVEPDCWALAKQDVNMTDEYKPMIYYASANAHSGNYSLILNKRSIYAMPKFEGDVSTLQLSMYLKQGMSKYQLQVGVMSDLDNPSTFVPVAILNNSGTGYMYRTIDFSSYTGNGHYIAFRNILAPGKSGDFSCNYIDDLRLESRCSIYPNELPYTDNFDSYTTSTTAKTGVAPDCWTLAHQDVVMTDEYKPMIYYNASCAHSSSYSLMLNKRGIYAMPAYEGDVRDLQLSFYVRQTQAKYQLQVGVMTDLSNASTFVPVATFNNTSTTTSVLRTVNFASYTGNGHHIAFRNILAAGQTGDYSCNYIDDLTLSMAGAKSAMHDDNHDVAVHHEMNVYPNPTTGMLTVEADEEVERVEVYDYTGRCVATFENKTTIDLSRLATGIYTLRVTLPERIEVRRVMKQ